MVCVTEFRRLVWFRVEILIVCLLAWSRPFAMAENSIVDSGVKGMSCLTPVNPLTPASDSSVNYFGSPSPQFHSENPLVPESDTDHNSADLFIQRRKFNTPVKNPADYDGSQSLRDYLRHFHFRCSVVNGWSKDEAAILLAASLRSETQKSLKWHV